MARPPKYNNVKELDAKIQEYFDTELENVTIPGIAFHLGFESRQSFYDYEKNEIFSYSIKRARLQIEKMVAAKLYGKDVTGVIFALKNMGWKDSTQTELLVTPKKIDTSKLSDEALDQVIAAIDGQTE